MRYDAVVAVAAVLTFGAGCTVTVRTGGSPPAHASAQAPAGTLTVPQAAELYQQLAGPGNQARDQWLAGGPTTARNLAVHEHRAAAVADASQVFAAQLRAHRWPARVVAAVQQLVADLDVRVRAFRLVAAAPSVAAYVWAADRVPLSSAAAGQIRLILGLPPGPTFCLCPSPA